MLDHIITSRHIIAKFTLVLSVLVMSHACIEPNPPTFIEISAPQSSTDALGPYQFSVHIRGDVERVRLFWKSESEANAISESSEVRIEGGSINLRSQESQIDGAKYWTGALDGQGRAVVFSWWIEAEGEGGKQRYPQQGVLSFTVNALDTQCTHDADCLAGFICHRTAAYCFQPPSLCQRDQDCSREQFCQVDTEQCRFLDAACIEDSECPQGQRCDNQSCTSECLEECDPGFACIDLRCQSTNCIQNEDCPSALPYCINQQCVATQSEVCDPSCSEEEACIDGMCQSAERCGDQLCELPFSCVEDQCVLTCFDQEDCPTDSFCLPLIGICQANLSRNLCAPCSLDDNSSCGEHTICVPNYSGCRPRCTQDSDCAEDHTCIEGGCVYAEESLCLGNECVTDGECSFLCLAGYCIGTPLCYEDTDCRDGEACFDNLCSAIDRCSSMYDCSDRERCVAGRCNPLPRSDANFCNACTHDLDCVEGQVCADLNNTGILSCYQPCYDLCDSDLQCLSVHPEFNLCLQFDPSTTCLANECGFDIFEPNDSVDQAILLESSQIIFGEICAEDSDWFRVDLADPHELSFNANTEDLSVSLLDEDLNIIAQITAPTSSFTLSTNIRYIKLTITGSSNVDFSYEISISPIEITMCIDDMYESNDDQDSAYSITAEEPYFGVFCANNTDWYQIPVRAEQDLAIEIQIFDAANVSLAYGEEGQRERLENSDGFFGVDIEIQNDGIFYLQLTCNDCFEPVDYFIFYFNNLGKSNKILDE